MMEVVEAQGMEPNLISYNAISACEKGLRRQRAPQLMEAMQAQGGETVAIGYSPTISAFENGT